MNNLLDLRARVRLHHRGRELVCTVGTYVIGRGSSCDVTVDDARVSRRHAQLVVTEDGASIHDLGSANGVFVDGEQVGSQPTPLKDGNRLMIGSEQLVVRIDAVGDDTDRGRTEPEPLRARTIRPARPRSESTKRTPSGVTKRGLALEVIGILADQALEAKNPARAEEVLSKHLVALLNAAEKATISEAARDSALRRALALARATARGSWFDYAIELLTRQNALPTEAQAEDLQSALAAVHDADTEKLGRYAKLVRALPMSAERTRALRLSEQLLRSAPGRVGR
jgi:pSer/pThr/pTyr-binding forkhead associated (FHA) protein